ncbi:MAG: N-acetylmuramoyl-L-alanine amidase [Lachnospiraceae bacterium]|nr:N-acetylmuramoyl-L-alanine amidase [Lachnospiraceae bacterium]
MVILRGRKRLRYLVTLLAICGLSIWLTAQARAEEVALPRNQKLEEAGAYYYYDANGRRVLNSWQKDPQTGIWNWYGKDGKQVFSDWIRDGSAWYYIEANGDYARSRWQGAYYLLADGKMAVSRWIRDDRLQAWYYLKAAGDFARSCWQNSCYLKADGRMAASEWIWDAHFQGWYYLESTGFYAKNKEIRTDGKLFFVLPDGKRAQDQLYGDYAYDAEGIRVSNGWFLDRATGRWQWRGPDGKQVYSTWVREKGDEWFYINDAGGITKSRWQGNYYLGKDGRMVRSDWIWDAAAGRWYWVDQNGVYDPEISRLRRMGNKTKTVFLDPGHGGYDPGASYGGVDEKDVAFSVYQKLKKRLEASGYTVFSSRTSDVYVDYITERSRLANASRADLFISLHFNAGGGRGIETYSYREVEGYAPRINRDLHNDPDRLKYSNQLALSLQSALINGTKAYNRGVKQATFAVLRETALPAALVEMGYLDNEEELAKIRQDSYRETLAECLYKGILNYYAQLK